MKSICLLLSFLPLLGACVAQQSVPLRSMYKTVLGKLPTYEQAELQPGYVYLEFESESANGLLVRSYADEPAGKLNAQDKIETFTVLDGAVIRLQQGLITTYNVASMEQWRNGRKYRQGGDLFIEYDLPASGLYSLRRRVTDRPITQFVGLLQPSQLFKRLLKSRLEFTIKRFDFEAPSLHGLSDAWTSNHFEPDYVKPVSAYVAYHDGKPIFGQQCFTSEFCVSYLIRTAQQPL